MRKLLNDLREYGDRYRLRKGLWVNRMPTRATRIAGPQVWTADAEATRGTSQSIQTSREHPAQFPKLLSQRCMKIHGFDSDNRPLLVMDPFMGIGTTGVVAQELGMEFTGFEIDTDYYHGARRLLPESVQLPWHG